MQGPAPVQSAVWLLCALLLALGGCTTSKAIVKPDQAAITKQLRVGDRVEVGTRDGKTYRIEIIGIDAEVLHGVNPITQASHQFPYSQILVVRDEEVSVGGTAAGALAVVATVAGAFAVYLLIIFAAL